MADAAAYEALRRRQVEENKRRMEDLGLRHLAAAAMPPQAKQLKHKARVPRAAASSTAPSLRRSGRVANLPEQPRYCELRNLKKKIGIGATAVERSNAIAKAKELEGKLGADYPTFVKTMTQHSATTFWLFCREHLPEHDEVVTLVGEKDYEFQMQYHKGTDRGYRITWKGFAINHKLDDGDCLVFQLIQPRKFKVYIIRASFLLGNVDRQEMATAKTESF